MSSAGIPVYTDRGPGGGIALLESYRTTLTGMNQSEAQALFMMSIPQALVDLGVGRELKSALLKLAAAMPPGQQTMKASTEQRVYLDSTAWQPASGPAPHLSILHEAVWQDNKVRLVFRGSFDAQIELELEPLGLVAKMNTWYLVGREQGYLRVLKVADILEVEALNESFTRDERFDLEAFWREWCIDSVRRRSQYNVHLRVAPSLFSKLRYYLDDEIKFNELEGTPADHGEWKEVVITYENFFQARQSVMSFGRAAEVIEPEVLKISVIDIAAQIVDFYRQQEKT